ncbi:hypothetical protein JTL66_34575, partial [Pseudomonas aeruginosa]|nr:hypothetical protein [Pseudomonas aeruginosa]
RGRNRRRMSSRTQQTRVCHACPVILIYRQRIVCGNAVASVRVLSKELEQKVLVSCGAGVPSIRPVPSPEPSTWVVFAMMDAGRQPGVGDEFEAVAYDDVPIVGLVY